MTADHAVVGQFVASCFDYRARGKSAGSPALLVVMSGGDHTCLLASDAFSAATACKIEPNDAKHQAWMSFASETELSDYLKSKTSQFDALTLKYATTDDNVG